jgi:nitric oxide synthase oxygenase domain/subunit
MFIFQCVDPELKQAGLLRHTEDDLVHVAMIATNVNRCVKKQKYVLYTAQK